MCPCTPALHHGSVKRFVFSNDYVYLKILANSLERGTSHSFYVHGGSRQKSDDRGSQANRILGRDHEACFSDHRRGIPNVSYDTWAALRHSLADDHWKSFATGR